MQEQQKTFLVFYKVGDTEISLGPFLATTSFHAIEKAYGMWAEKYETRSNYIAK